MTSMRLKDVLEAEVAASPLLLVLDLSRLTFMDSWALHTILAVARRLRNSGGTLALAAPSAGIRRVLELSGADTLVDVYASVQEASGARLTSWDQVPAPGTATGTNDSRTRPTHPG